MINRSKMPRQLRAQGGITNVTPREGFFLGGIKKRIRKLIPNEIADIAVKAAPFVAPFQPGIAAAMRGIGRFDQRGSISDALKQGALTFGFGKGVGALGGAQSDSLFGGQTFTKEGFKEGPIGRLFQRPLTEGNPNFTGGDANKGKLLGTSSTPATTEKGVGFIKDAAKYIDNLPIIKDLPPLVQQQIIVGGVTGAATYVYEKFLAEEPPQEEGETYEQYMARRKENVGRKMKGYFDNYFKFDKDYSSMTDEQKQAFIDRVNVKDGGRIGYQTGGVTMGSTLQQNIASNRQQAAGIQAMLNAARAKAGLPTVQAPQQTAPLGISSLPTPTQTTGPIKSIPAPQPTLPVEPRTDQDLIEGFAKFKKQNPNAMSGTGMAALVQGVLPGGAPITFSGSTESNAFNKYLESLGLSRANIVKPRENIESSLKLAPSMQQISSAMLSGGNTMPGMKGPEDQSYQPGIGGESLDKFGNPVDPLLGSMDLPIADFGDVTKFGVQKGSGKFTDLKRTRDPSMDPNFMNLSPQEQDKRFEEHVKSMEAFDKRFGSFADGRTIDPAAGRSSYRDILNVIQNDYPEAFKQLKGDETLAELDNLSLKLGGYDTFDLSKTSKNPRDEFGNLVGMSIGGRVGFSKGSDIKIKLKQIGYEDTLLDTMTLKELIDLLDSEEGTFTDQGTYREPAKKGGMPTGIMKTNKAGVMERDYRDKGGFVPVGIKEKADDVPAMLSKNEFVMTANAVRGAGNGSIEKGAQKMYDTMKRLEKRAKFT